MVTGYVCRGRLPKEKAGESPVTGREETQDGGGRTTRRVPPSTSGEEDRETLTPPVPAITVLPVER